MAAMEQLEIHSKSYLVRWCTVKAEHTISWSIQPHKKPINFGIFKHPGSELAPTPKLPSSSFEVPPTPGLRPADASPDQVPAQSNSSAAMDKLKGIGLRLISWYGLCEANQVSTGHYDVPKCDGGMFALVFDNTFAKQFSKTVTLVLLTYPTNSPPQSNHIQGLATSSASSLKLNTGTSRSNLRADQRTSSDSAPNAPQPLTPSLVGSNAQQRNQESSTSTASANFYTGILQKRRRKRHQGYARRFFSLDFNSCTLSYYHDRSTQALRGAVPLSVAAIGANATTREISIDSGAEVWHLRAQNQKDFEMWKDALEQASRPHLHNAAHGLRLDTVQRSLSASRPSPEDESEWARVELLANNIAAIRETVRQLAKDTDPKYFLPNASSPALVGIADIPSRPASSSEASPSDAAVIDDYFPPGDRRPFWKRKVSAGRQLPITTGRRSVSAQPVLPLSISSPRSERASSSVARSVPLESFPEDAMHDQSMRLLNDLNIVVAEFSTLFMQRKQRQLPVPITAASRLSMDSLGSEEFFDAEGGENPQLLTIQHESDDEADTPEQVFTADEHDDSSASELDDGNGFERSGYMGQKAISIFPSKPKSLVPLPLPQISRRTTIPAPKVSPPSWIGFLRKNVGKDLSTITMPVAANEPISLLQRTAEQMEYSALLDSASEASCSPLDRLLHVSAFAISSVSSLRVKERAIRKPFNPMLGETFELVREDRGYRFIAEKVSHRPVRIACQADSERWSLSQSPKPIQKFWGKSAELITEGCVRLIFHTTGDRFSWTTPTCFLRNIIAGEKYVEPVGKIVIANETSGDQAVATFKPGGMFSGRAEEVNVQVFDASGRELSCGLIGKWTESLSLTENGNPRPKALWSTGELVPNAVKCYGFTTFTASLNEISSRDRAYLAVTDSRLRVDQRAAEEGDMETAEAAKAQLEDAQRERRRIMEESETQWRPMWFTMVDGFEGEETWKLKTGKESYWEQREKRDWKGVTPVLRL